MYNNMNYVFGAHLLINCKSDLDKNILTCVDNGDIIMSVEKFALYQIGLVNWNDVLISMEQHRYYGHISYIFSCNIYLNCSPPTNATI